MAAGPSYMVVSDTFPDLLPQFGQVGVELRNIVLEQRLLHCNESILALDDVACVTQRIVGVVHVKFEIAEVMHLEASLFLCRSTQSHAGRCQRQQNLFP